MASNFKDMLKSTASRVAESIGLPRITRRQKTYEISGKAGKRGQPYRMYTQYERTGPLYIQTGLQPNGKPMMERRYKHRFLHPTKGWRTHSVSRPTVALQNMQQPRAYGPGAAGHLNRYGRFVFPKKGGFVLVPCVKNAHLIERAA